MIHAQDAKYFAVLPPISVAGGATATTIELDTLGYDYVELLVQSGLVGANGVATIKVQESDVSGSGQVDVTGLSFTALVDADDGKILGAFIDVKKRKRYLTLVITNGATNASVMSAIARLSRAAQSPTTATERGLQEQKIV